VPSGLSIRVGFSTSVRTTIAAACSALIGGIGLSRRHGVIIGVRTNGMWMFVNVMWSESVSVPTTSANASSAALVGMYELYFDGHHTFAIVQPIGGVDHRAPYRASCRVHQIVDVAEPAEDLFDGVLHRR